MTARTGEKDDKDRIGRTQRCGRGAAGGVWRACLGTAVLVVVFSLSGVAAAQGEFCASEAGTLSNTVTWVMIVISLMIMIAALFFSGALRSIPVIGWAASAGAAMMGGAVSSVVMIFVGLLFIGWMAGQVAGFSMPSCIPIVGGNVGVVFAAGLLGDLVRRSGRPKPTND